MTIKQALILALNGDIGRNKLIEVAGIVLKDGKYVLKRKEVVKKIAAKPTQEEVEAYFKSKGYTKEGAKKAFDYYEANDWKDSEDKVVISWKQKMIGNWFRPEFKEVSKEITLPENWKDPNIKLNHEQMKKLTPIQQQWKSNQVAKMS